MTAANRFPWTLAADGKAARHERGAELVAKGDPAAVNKAMREAVAEHGLALARVRGFASENADFEIF
jgi:hypothetical protein